VTSAWSVARERGTCAALHAASAALLDEAVPLRREVRILEATDVAVVLGRAQPASDVDAGRARAAGIGVVRRRSGGGAILVGPDTLRWVDVVVPVTDPLWHPDVGRAFWWLGERWAAALASAGVAGASVWQGAFVRSAWSARVCIAGLGPGEVTVGGRKVVGLAQRRSARGCLFQCAVLADWAPGDLLGVLDLPPAERRDGERALAEAGLGIGGPRADVCLAALEASFVDGA